MTEVSKTAKVIAALESGVELTGKQISARYGVKNARALISTIRMQGYPIFEQTDQCFRRDLFQVSPRYCASFCDCSGFSGSRIVGEFGESAK